MKKKVLFLPVILITLMISSCGTDELQAEVQTAVDTYNSAVASYNEEIAPYNEAVKQIEELKATIDPNYEQTFYYQCQGCGSAIKSDRDDMNVVCGTCHKPLVRINENGVIIE